MKMIKQFIWLSSMVILVLGGSVKSNLNRLNIDQLDQLANVSRFFSTAQICGHEVGVKTKVDNEGRTIISFNVRVKPNESDDDLCKCMWKYMNQRCWLAEAERKCQVTGTKLTLLIIGPPNPDYDPLEPLPILNAPLKTLGDVIKYYPDLELADHKCSPTTNTSAKGLTCISVECKLMPKSPKPEEVCKNILKWMNQCEWLGKVEHTCSSKAGSVILEMTGN